MTIYGTNSLINLYLDPNCFALPQRHVVLSLTPILSQSQLWHIQMRRFAAIAANSEEYFVGRPICYGVGQAYLRNGSIAPLVLIILPSSSKICC